MRLVHFSDIHCFAGSMSRRSFFDKRLLGFLNFKIFRRHDFNYQYLDKLPFYIASLFPDIIICTGDLTTNGSEEDFAIAVTCLEKIKAICPAEIIVIPGNHDAYIFDLELAQKRKEIFSKLNRLTNRVEVRDQEIIYGNIHLYPLDAALPTPFWCSGGVIKESQQEWFIKKMQEPRKDKECRISLCHFPTADQYGNSLGFRRMLRGGNIILNALEGRQLDIALCGHIHTPFCRQGKSATSGLEISAGSLTKYGLLNVIDFDEKMGIFKQSWVSLSDNQEIKPVGSFNNIFFNSSFNFTLNKSFLSVDLTENK